MIWSVCHCVIFDLCCICAAIFDLTSVMSRYWSGLHTLVGCCGVLLQRLQSVLHCQCRLRARGGGGGAQVCNAECQKSKHQTYSEFDLFRGVAMNPLQIRNGDVSPFSLGPVAKHLLVAR